MKFPFYIARRYLVSKKSHNAINLISRISMVGVSLGALALVVILSVFNGFDSLIKSMMSSFYPDIKISPASGKTFVLTDSVKQIIANMDGVIAYADVVEEDALFKFNDQYHLGRIKGIDSGYAEVTGIDTMMVEGKFTLHDGPFEGTIIGLGVQYYLNARLNFDKPIHIYIPKRTERFSLHPDKALNRTYLFPTGVYQVDQDIDSRYIFIPLKVARQLLDYTNEISHLEIGVSNKTQIKPFKENLQKLLQPYNLVVETRYEQNKVFYKTMQSEKWMIFFILIFILFVASFNVISSLTMLIIEKKKDIATLRSLGADVQKIKSIFLTQGWLVSALGAIIGICTGVLIVWVQQQFGLIKLGGSGSFIIDAYPVKLKFSDTMLSFVVVLIIGFAAAWIPIRYITGKFVSEQNISAQ